MGALDKGPKDKPNPEWRNDTPLFGNAELRSAGAIMAAANPHLEDSLRSAGRMPLPNPGAKDALPSYPTSAPSAPSTASVPPAPSTVSPTQGSADLKAALDEIASSILPPPKSWTSNYKDTQTYKEASGLKQFGYDALAKINPLMVKDLTREPPKDPETGLNAYEVGIPYVPEDEVAKLHKGEAVIPADQNPNNPAADLKTPLQEISKETLGAWGSQILKEGAVQTPPPISDREAEKLATYSNPSSVNLAGLPFTSSMSRGERIQYEQTLASEAPGGLSRGEWNEYMQTKTLSPRDERQSIPFSAGRLIDTISTSAPAAPAAPAAGLPGFAQVPNAATAALKGPEFPGTGLPKFSTPAPVEKPLASERYASPEGPAMRSGIPGEGKGAGLDAASGKRLTPAQQADADVKNAATAKRNETSWNRVMADRSKEIERFGVDTRDMSEDQIVQAWKDKKKELNDAGLSSIEVRAAVEAKVKEAATRAGVDPAAAKPAGLAALYQETKRELLDTKITERYSKYSWFNNQDKPLAKGEEPSRRQKEWMGYKAVKANPRFNATDFVKPDGTFDFKKAEAAVQKDAGALAEAKRKTEALKDRADLRGTDARTRYTEASILAMKTPDSLTRKERATLNDNAMEAKSELTRMQAGVDDKIADEYADSLLPFTDPKDGTAAAANAKERAVNRGELWADAITQGGQPALDKLLASKNPLDNRFVVDYAQLAVVSRRAIR